MMLLDKRSNTAVTAREKGTTIYIAYCVVVGLFIIVVALIYRPHSTPVATHTNATSQRHPAGSSTSRSGSTPLAVNGNGKGTQHLSGVSSTPTKPSQSAAASAPLSNSGPGNVIGLFALVSVLASVAWRRKLIHSVIR